ncbi:MAG TPA: uroporphyrinogen-III synthase [Polyangiaceae bacterium]|jgi:uroporphyrinogen-III synthase|nr:uroporphyrinogen-III synthase [Polyangiaceae bacterium]
MGSEASSPVGLSGARVALLEARMESELASLVRRHGGDPVCVPAMREVERDCASEASAAITSLAQEGAVVVLATGVGLARWLAVAAAMGQDAAIRPGLSRSTIVCRGPKPVAVLKREGLPVHVRAPAPHTTTELLAVLEDVPVEGHEVVFVHDGGGSRAVPEALAARGARVHEVQPYAWALPEDVAPLQALVRSILAGGVEAVAVTTQAQARNLFAIAEGLGLRDALAAALRDRVVVAAVGPTSARALAELGATARVVPESPKMGSLVVALAAYLGARRQANA